MPSLFEAAPVLLELCPPANDLSIRNKYILSLLDLMSKGDESAAKARTCTEEKSPVA